MIVTYNSADQLDGCLAALAEGHAGIDLVAVVVADNASSDRSVEAALRWRPALPLRTVQLDRNAGYAAGVNAAIGALDLGAVDAVLVLNPDITVLPGAIATLAADLGVSGRGITVPRLLNPDGTFQPSLRRTPTLAGAAAEAVLGGPVASRLGVGELMMEAAPHERPGPASWATGAAMLLSTRMIGEIGPWDESFLLYGEETEYALRANDFGWGLWFDPAAEMVHVGGTQTVSNPDLFALLAVNRVRLFRRRHGRPAALAYHAVVVLGELVRAGLGRRPSRRALVALVRPSRRMAELPR